jgi:galactose mutarotase-like enzyme
LHGGLKGFDKVVWDAEPVMTEEGQGVKLTYNSVDEKRLPRESDYQHHVYSDKG